MNTMRPSGRRAEPCYQTKVEAIAAAYMSTRLHIPAEVYAAVRANDSGVAVRAFGPFTEETEAKTFVAEELGGNGYVVPFELVFGAR